jgi:hypothetical protein
MTRESGHAAYLISDPETTTSKEGARHDSVSDFARFGWLIAIALWEGFS